MTQGVRLLEKCAARLRVLHPSDFSCQVTVLSGTKADSLTDEYLLANPHPEPITGETSHILTARQLRHQNELSVKDRSALDGGQGPTRSSPALDLHGQPLPYEAHYIAIHAASISSRATLTITTSFIRSDITLLPPERAIQVPIRRRSNSIAPSRTASVFTRLAGACFSPLRRAIAVRFKRSR